MEGFPSASSEEQEPERKGGRLGPSDTASAFLSGCAWPFISHNSFFLNFSFSIPRSTYSTYTRAWHLASAHMAVSLYKLPRIRFSVIGNTRA